MKKIFISFVLTANGLCVAHTHHIRLNGFTKKYDGTYEFSLKGDPGTKTKTWRIKIIGGAPTLDFEGAKNISPKTEVIIESKDLLKVDGKGWCYRKLEVSALSGRLRDKGVKEGKVAMKRLIPAWDFCKGHQFSVRPSDRGLIVEDTGRY